MLDFEQQDGTVSFQDRHGVENVGTLVRLTRHLAVFEVCNPGSVLQVSEALNDFKVQMQGRAAYSGKAVLRGVLNTGLVVVCEASLDQGWLDIDLGFVQDSQRLGAEFENFFTKWQKLYRIEGAFKVVVADIQSFLGEMRLWLEQAELGIRSSPSADRVQLERQVAALLGQRMVPALTAMFEKFEDAIRDLDPAAIPPHTIFARRQLHPLLLCSPFLYRCFSKPLGYAGDYEMVNMILRDPFEGSSLFAKIVNLWFWSQPPAEAHRNRVRHLADRVLEECARVLRQGRSPRIFNVGCGPAAEVQLFLQEQEIANQTEFSLLDFNEETLQYGMSVLQGAKEKNRRSTRFKFIKKSVHQILKEAGKTVERSNNNLFDLVYCAGLFDYLPDPICRRLIAILYEYVAPGGLLITTNVNDCNPRRLTMEYIMEWHLIYRSGAQMAGLRPEHIPGDIGRVTSDLTGVNLYYELRKP